MKTHEKIFLRIRDDKGATAILVALLMVVLVGIIALAVDTGYLFTKKTELQNVADAASLAGARQLGAIYQTMSYEEQQAYVCDPSAIIAVVQEVAGKNQAEGTVTINDIKIGDWNTNTKTFTEKLAQPDAVWVRAAREDTGAVNTFFAGIFGINAVDVSADAIAALTGQSTADPGDLELPIGISRYWFDNNSCNDWIKFSPTNDPDSCAGWNTFEISPSNDVTVRKILDETLQNGETIAGETYFEFIGGDLSVPTFDALMTLFQNKGYDVSAQSEPPNPQIEDVSGEPMHDATGHPDAIPLLDADGNPLLYPDGTPRNAHEWETSVVVYDRDDCSNPNQSILVLGFARIVISDVLGPPDKLIRGKVICEYVESEDTRGGGGEYGVKGSIPGLVE